MYEYVGNFSTADQILETVNTFPFKYAPQGYWVVDGREQPIEKLLGPLVSLPSPWAFMMLTRLTQNDMIPVHQDKPLDKGITRYHFVLESNDKSWCMHNNQWQQMEAGGIYTMKPEFIHAAINWGSTPRTHLVVDV